MMQQHHRFILDGRQNNSEGSKMDCVCKKNKGMTKEECGFCICCEDYGNGVECDCE